MSNMSLVDWVTVALVIVGGLNWGLVGVLDFNLVAALFGDGSMLSRVVYVLVGVSAVYMIYKLATGNCCKASGSGGA